jgi:2,5-diketo-D-gluconate reductase A
MNKKIISNGINRRSFLKTSAKFASSAAILSLGGSKLFGRENVSSADVAIDKVTLNNGTKMPILGFGTLYLNGEVGARCVADAISLGYRLLDTARIYGNEESVGAGIKLSGIKREELFVTSKLWVDDSGYENAKKAFDITLKKLGTDYLDLYLIHRPRGDVKGSWKAMEELNAAGRIKAIGVSNFDEQQLKDLMADSKVKPVINQIETHAYFQENSAYDWLKKYGVQLEAWSPFAEGRNGLFTNSEIAAIGKQYNKTVAQICLRWHYQRGIVAIPRSSQKAHMKENLEIFDFKLNEADMMKISKLDLNKSQFPEWT